jgi:hypothetical protein
MNEQFVNKAIEKDRYLKARLLVKRFEDVVMRELKNTCKDVIQENSELFPDDPSLDTNKFDSGSLRTLRVEVTLDRLESLDGDSSNVKFYLAVEWTEPEERGEKEPVDQSLCVVLYKIRPNPRDDYDSVKRQSKQDNRWNIRYGDDVNDRERGVFYIPVRDYDGLDDAFTELKHHFSEYGDEFGVIAD